MRVLVFHYSAGYILHCMRNLRSMVMKSEENMLMRLDTLTPKSARYQNKVKDKNEIGMKEKENEKWQDNDDGKALGKGTSLAIGSMRTAASEDGFTSATKRNAKDDDTDVDNGLKKLTKQSHRNYYSKTELLSSVAQQGGDSSGQTLNISRSPTLVKGKVRNVFLSTQNESFCSMDETIAPMSLVQSIAETPSGTSSTLFHGFNQQKTRSTGLQHSVLNATINPIAQNNPKSGWEVSSVLPPKTYDSSEGKSNSSGKHNPLFWMMSKHSLRSSHSERLRDHQKIRKLWFNVVKTKLTRLIVSGATISLFVVGILLFITTDHLQNREQSWSESYDTERDSYNIGTDIGFWGMLLTNCYVQFYSSCRKTSSSRSNVPALLPPPG
mmetsp:Transcript_7862/g.10802  ORF Transcript_7862/g.10802 Transcript_7862/m.10802 type:complete len:382 (-) Transcript_7862:98-1243(-)